MWWSTYPGFKPVCSICGMPCTHEYYACGGNGYDWPSEYDIEISFGCDCENNSMVSEETFAASTAHSV